MHNMLHLTGGIKANLWLGHVMMFTMSMQRPANGAPPDDSPGTAFTLRNASLIEKEQAPWLRGDTQDMDVNFREPGFCGDSANTTPAGLVPVVCLAEANRPDNTPVDAEAAAAFNNVYRLFLTLINNGIVCRPPPQGRAAPPDIGKMVRAGKGWRWQQERRAWYVMWTILRNQRTPVLGSTLSATEFWMRLWRW